MKEWIVKICTIKDLRALYGVSHRTMVQQLKHFEKEIGKRHGYFYTILQVIKIFELIGEPCNVKIIYPCGYKHADV